MSTFQQELGSLVGETGPLYSSLPKALHRAGMWEHLPRPDTYARTKAPGLLGGDRVKVWQSRPSLGTGGVSGQGKERKLEERTGRSKVPPCPLPDPRCFQVPAPSHRDTMRRRVWLWEEAGPLARPPRPSPSQKPAGRSPINSGCKPSVSLAVNMIPQRPDFQL